MTHGWKSLIENMLYDDHSGSIRHAPQKLDSRSTAVDIMGNGRRRELAVSGADVRVNRDVVRTNVSLSLLRPNVLSVLYWKSRHSDSTLSTTLLHLRISCCLFRSAAADYKHLLIILPIRDVLHTSLHSVVLCHHHVPTRCQGILARSGLAKRSERTRHLL